MRSVYALATLGVIEAQRCDDARVRALEVLGG